MHLVTSEGTVVVSDTDRELVGQFLDGGKMIIGGSHPLPEGRVGAARVLRGGITLTLDLGKPLVQRDQGLQCVKREARSGADGTGLDVGVCRRLLRSLQLELQRCPSTRRSTGQQLGEFTVQCRGQADQGRDLGLPLAGLDQRHSRSRQPCPLCDPLQGQPPLLAAVAQALPDQKPVSPVDEVSWGFGLVGRDQAGVRLSVMKLKS